MKFTSSSIQPISPTVQGNKGHFSIVHFLLHSYLQEDPICETGSSLFSPPPFPCSCPWRGRRRRRQRPCFPLWAKECRAKAPLSPFLFLGLETPSRSPLFLFLSWAIRLSFSSYTGSSSFLPSSVLQTFSRPFFAQGRKRDRSSLRRLLH